MTPEGGDPQEQPLINGAQDGEALTTYGGEAKRERGEVKSGLKSCYMEDGKAQGLLYSIGANERGELGLGHAGQVLGFQVLYSNTNVGTVLGVVVHVTHAFHAYAANQVLRPSAQGGSPGVTRTPGVIRSVCMDHGSVTRPCQPVSIVLSASSSSECQYGSSVSSMCMSISTLYF